MEPLDNEVECLYDKEAVEQEVQPIKKKPRKNRASSTDSVSLDSAFDLISEDGSSDIDEKLKDMLNNIKLEPAKLMEVEVQILNKEFNALVDTGAVNNFIKASVAQRLELEIDHKTSDTVCGLGTKDINTVGTVKTKLNLYGNSVKKTQFKVVLDSDISYEIIFGKKFLKEHKACINMAQNIFTFQTDKGTIVEIATQWKGQDKTKDINYQRVNVMASVDMSIHDGLNLVPCEFDVPHGTSESKYLYEGCVRNKGLRAIDGVLSQNRGEILIKKLYGDGKETKIRKGDIIGKVHTMHEVNEEEDGCDWNIEDIKEKVNLEHLDGHQREIVYDILLKSSEVICKNEYDIGMAKVSPHKIELYDARPIWIKPRRFSEPVNKEIEEQCKQLQLMDIIEKSQSRFCAPIVPVRKTDGSLRMCVDYRKINAVTKEQNFPIPNLTDSIYSIKDIKFFTKIDLIKGYYQIPVEEESRQYTAFATHSQQYQFKRLPFGLKNSGLQFQRYINEILSDFICRSVLAYQDDILILSRSFKEHVEMVRKVLNTLRTHGIKIQASKCEFFRQEVTYLGHVAYLVFF